MQLQALQAGNSGDDLVEVPGFTAEQGMYCRIEPQNIYDFETCPQECECAFAAVTGRVHAIAAKLLWRNKCKRSSRSTQETVAFRQLQLPRLLIPQELWMEIHTSKPWMGCATPC